MGRSNRSLHQNSQRTRRQCQSKPNLYLSLTLQCIVPLTPARFCSGANDRLLCIWKNDGELINKLERREEENIQCLLPIGGNRLITGSNSSLLCKSYFPAFFFNVNSGLSNRYSQSANISLPSRICTLFNSNQRYLNFFTCSKNSFSICLWKYGWCSGYMANRVSHSY